MFILYGFIVALIFGIIDVLFLARNKNKSTIAYNLISDILLSNIFALFAQIYILKAGALILVDEHDKFYDAKYVGLVTAFSLVVILLRKLFNTVLPVEPINDEYKKKNKKLNLTLNILSLIFFVVATALITATKWGLKTFGKVSADQLIINLASPTDGTSTAVMSSIIDGPVLLTAFLTAIISCVIFSNYHLKIKIKEKIVTLITCKAKNIGAFVLATVFLFYSLGYGMYTYSFKKLFNAYFVSSQYIEDNYVDPDQANITFPEHKRNLIHIYLESVENTYLSKEDGGNMDINLMPELQELAKEGYVFSNTDGKFGGPASCTGGTWSVASMVNQSTGLPMKATTSMQYNALDRFMPGVTTIGDILHDAGYEQSVMFGADAAFGGLDFFYTSHGDFNIIDYKKAKELELIPSDYYVWWGYEDDKLYEFAKDEITRLSQTGKPFNFVMENADTHFPDGYLSPNATETVHESQYANVIFYSQAEVVKFVRWIQDQPFYENTTVVLIGDHLSMDYSFFANYVDKDYNRTTFNLILNPDPSLLATPQDRFVNRDWANFDMFPTLLKSIGVDFDGEKLGLGTNLFSNEQTLFERDGIAYTNNHLEMKSNYYNENFLVKKSESESN